VFSFSFSSCGFPRASSSGSEERRGERVCGGEE